MENHKVFKPFIGVSLLILLEALLYRPLPVTYFRML